MALTPEDNDSRASDQPGGGADNNFTAQGRPECADSEHSALIDSDNIAPLPADLLLSDVTESDVTAPLIFSPGVPSFSSLLAAFSV
jgi:hypothetical protein